MRTLILISLLISAIILGITPALANRVIFDVENIDPVTNSWIAGTGAGTQITERDVGSFLKWTYTFGTTTADNYPTIELLNGNKNWSGATSLGVWMYFDLTGPKTGWTIEPTIMSPSPTAHPLLNWNVGTTGVPNNTWVYHEWTGLDTIGNISNVSHLRFGYHAGDGWAELSKSNQVAIYLDDITLGGLDEPPPSNTLTVFDMEGTNPVSTTWVDVGHAGTITTSLDGNFVREPYLGLHGLNALKWEYTNTGSFGGNYVVIQMNVPGERTNWTGATTFGMWLFLDLTGPKKDWTIQPGMWYGTGTIAHYNELGNWNVGGYGIPPRQWVWHEWNINSSWDISSVFAVRVYYAAGDGWADIAQGGTTVPIYLDDITAMGAAPLPPTIISSPGAIRPLQSKEFSVGRGVPPFTWALSTTGYGTLNVDTGTVVTFTAGSTTGTLELIVTDNNHLSGRATIEITPTTAWLVEDTGKVIIYQRRPLGELFE
ncbi:MAG: hypothetical protein ACE14V_03155 [bacterium]